jgi:hypothetical protein
LQRRSPTWVGQAGGYVALSCRGTVHNFRSYLDLDVTAVCGRVDVLIPRGYEVELKPPVGLAVRAIEPPSAGANDHGRDDVEAGHLTVHVLAFFGCAELRQP